MTFCANALFQGVYWRTRNNTRAEVCCLLVYYCIKTTLDMQPIYAIYRKWWHAKSTRRTPSTVCICKLCYTIRVVDYEDLLERKLTFSVKGCLKLRYFILLSPFQIFNLDMCNFYGKIKFWIEVESLEVVDENGFWCEK